jgi:acyl carrier protein
MSKSELKDDLRKLICDIAEIDELPEDAAFKVLGIVSMMGIEIVAAIERQ